MASMATSSLCRTCLSFGNKMYDLRNNQLQDTFQNITGKKLNTKLGRTLICYLCYAQLKKYRSFSDMSWKSEVILNELINKGIEITQETLKRLGRPTIYSFTPIDYYYNGLKDPPNIIKGDSPLIESLVTVKVEKVEEEEEKTEAERLFIEPLYVPETIKEEEVLFEEDIDVAGEVTLYECEISKIEDSEEYVDVEENLSQANVTTKMNCHKSNKKKPKFHKHKEYVDIEESLPQANVTTKMNCHKNKEKYLKPSRYYTCDCCNKTFTLRCNIIKHIKSQQNRPFKCHLCDKAFGQHRYLKDHIKIHIGAKPYICHICGKPFSDGSGLSRHKITHDEVKKSSVKKHTCHVCDKVFYRKHNLIIHMRIHSKVKPYTCIVCNHSFTQKCSLNGHMRIHNNDRRHFCSVCNKSFIRRAHVYQHMIVHQRS